MIVRLSLVGSPYRVMTFVQIKAYFNDRTTLNKIKMELQTTTYVTFFDAGCFLKLIRNLFSIVRMRNYIVDENENVQSFFIRFKQKLHRKPHDFDSK